MSKQFVLIGAILCLGNLANAQPYTSVGGRFQVDEVKGCAPFSITLTNLLAGNCDASNPCSMDYEGNNQQSSNLFNYVYNNPGIYRLKVLYQGQGADEITITVVENIEPDFEIYSCANADVTIKVLEKSYQQLVIDFTNDGVPEIIIPSGNNALASHDYATVGSKTISVRGRNLSSADNCDSKVQSFDALAALPAPSISSLSILNEASIRLDFTTQIHIQYRLEIAVNNSSNFQLLKTFYDESTTNIPGLKTDVNYYCFRLGAYDVCNNNSTYSNIICSSDLELAIESGVNRLNWSTGSVGIQSTEIERNNDTYVIIPGAPNSFNDIDIECKENYCYRIVNRYARGATSRSLQYCGESFRINNPVPIQNTSAVVSNQGVNLEWIQDPASNPSSYQVFRSSDGENFGLIAGSPNITFTDANYTTENNFSYRIDYTDECDNDAPEGLIIDPIKLKGTINNNVVTLEWNEYAGWLNGVNSYIIDKFNQQNNLIQSINVGINRSFVDEEPDPNNQLVRYRIRAVANQSGIKPSISNELTFVKDSRIFSPTAFSPNGDKLNDTFHVSGQFIVKMELSIFNRWGVLIFNTDSKDETWDGTINGKPAAEDAYVWHVQVTDLAGRSYKESGTVALLRRNK